MIVKNTVSEGGTDRPTDKPIYNVPSYLIHCNKLTLLPLHNYSAIHTVRFVDFCSGPFWS